MKTYYQANQSRRWTCRLLAVGLGLTALTGQAAPAPSAPANDAKGSNNNADNAPPAWENQTLDQMKHIQQQMDDLFRDSLNDLNALPDKDLFTASGPRFDASATVQDGGGNYVASFYLPKRDLSNVKVNIKDDALTVNASAEQTTKSKAAGQSSETEMLSQYEQIVSLPGPVDASKMKVEKKGDYLVVTMPKRENATGSTK